MNNAITLGEAIRFRYLQTDLFTTDYFSVHFILPLERDTVAGYTLLSKLFKKGCRSYPTQREFAKRLEELYASSLGISVSKQGEGQILSLGMEFLSSRFVLGGEDIAQDACKLLSDVICDPYLENGIFASAFVEREKIALKDQLRATINDKRAYVLKRCRETMCEGEAYSLALEGTEESIDAITPDFLWTLYQKMLREAQIEIFYIGKEAAEIAEARARMLVSAFGSRAPVQYKTVFVKASETVKRVSEPIDAKQGKLAMGFRTGMDEKTSIQEKDALLLFNIVYGTSPVSKLFMNVREKRSLCYYCSSRNDNQKGILFVQSGVENENAAAAEEEILFQLQEISNGHIDDAELVAAKQAFRDLTRSVSDSPYMLEQWYLKRALAGDHRSPEEMNDAIDALSAEDIARVAERITLDTVFFLYGTAEEEAENDESL